MTRLPVGPAPFRSAYTILGPTWHPARSSGTFVREAHYNKWDVEHLYVEHQQLRWGIFSMHWSIIGWCATYDTGQIVKLLTDKPGLQGTLMRLIERNKL